MLTTIREEQLLAKFAGEDVAVPQPCTRTEKFLAKMAGLDVQTPTPITREEQILNKIAEGGGGGGDSDYSIAEVTIENNEAYVGQPYMLPVILEDEFGLMFIRARDDAYTLSVVLYKGSCMVPVTENPVISGDAAYTEGHVMISGDCTLKGVLAL